MIRTDFLVNVSEADYFGGELTEVPALSQSIGKLVLKSPKQAWAAHPRLGGKPRAPSDEMELGNILDELVLGGSKRIAVCNLTYDAKHKTKPHQVVDDFKTDAAKEFRDGCRASGMLPLTQAKHATYQTTADIVTRELAQAGITLDGVAQSVLLWSETATNGNKVQCCARLDMLWPQHGRILDFKTGADCDPEGLGRKVHYGKLHMQAASYLSAVEHVFPALAGRATFENVWMETRYPHDPYASEMDGEALAVGRALWQRAIDRWEECSRQGVWPGYAYKKHRVTLPPYATDALMEDYNDDK